MWRDLEEEAISIGLDLNYFWSLNVKQYAKHIRAYNQKQKERYREVDYMNFMLGKYISFAVNEPSKYPTKPFLDEAEEKHTEMTVSEMERQAKINTVLMGGVINDTRRTTSLDNSEHNTIAEGN